MFLSRIVQVAIAPAGSADRHDTATAEPGPESGDDNPAAGGRCRDLATAV